MNFKEYQKQAIVTKKKWDDKNFEMMYLAMSLAGESGEVIEIIKKHMRDGREIDIEKLKYEIGDVMWYIASLCDCMGFDMGEVAHMNIEKLRKRHGGSFSGYGNRSGE